MSNVGPVVTGDIWRRSNEKESRAKQKAMKSETVKESDKDKEHHNLCFRPAANAWFMKTVLCRA